MKTLGVKGLKGFKSGIDIDLSPITILLGRNSSGKSSFARIFPLMKQTISSAAPGNILWYGDFVDFGDFKTAINSELGSNGEIEFHFAFSSNVSPRRAGYWDGEYDYRDSQRNTNKTTPIDIRVKYINAKLGQTSISECIIQIYDHTISLKIDKGGALIGLDVNGTSYLKNDKNYKKSRSKGIVPHIHSTEIIDYDGSPALLRSEFYDISEFMAIISKIAKANSTEKYKYKIARQIRLDTKRQMLNDLRNSQRFSPHIAKKASSWDINSEEFNDLVNNFILFLWKV